MNVKTVLTAVTVIAFFALATIVVAATLYKLWYPNTGVIGQATLETYLDGVLWQNNTAIDWGSCIPGETYYYENLTVVNTGNMPLTVILVPEGLPSDWTLAWQGNNTLLVPGGKTGGWLNLTIPATATEWPSWGFWIRGEA